MPLLEQVLGQYPKDVKIVYKSFPLKSHKFAMQAAKAAIAAESQGKFWEFNDLLFKDYNKLNDQKIAEIAATLGMDQKALEKKMEDPGIARKISQDINEGIASGVSGTPTIFINGRLLRDRSMSGFRALIEKELKKKAGEKE